jgi:hypothetical protein
MATIIDLIRQIQETHKLVQKQFAPLVELQARLKESLRPVIEARERLNESLKPILEAQRRAAELAAIIRLPDYVATELARINEFALAYRKSLENLITPAFQELQESLRTLPKRTRKVLLALAQHGWFMDLEMPMPGLWRLQKALESGDIAEAEAALIDYFRGRLPAIAESLEERYPHRGKIIKAAFTAHERGEYELSVPVFLVQADGICQELIDLELFRKKNKKPATAAYVEGIEVETFRSALLDPLAHCLPISASASERGPEFSGLNRHQVLHGESFNYGTELNSLRAVSLLNYIAHLLGNEDPQS